MCADEQMFIELEGMAKQRQYTEDEEAAAINEAKHHRVISIVKRGQQIEHTVEGLRKEVQIMMGKMASQHSNSTPRPSNINSPRTPLQPLDRMVTTPTPRSSSKPRMGSAIREGCAPNAHIATQNYIKEKKTGSKRKLSIDGDDRSDSASKLSRLSASRCEDKENIATQSPSIAKKTSKNKLRRLSAGSKSSLKKLICSPKRRGPAKRSPMLTNGILLRNKYGQPLYPPGGGEYIDPVGISAVRKTLQMDTPSQIYSQQPFFQSHTPKKVYQSRTLQSNPQTNTIQSHCLGPRSCGDGEEQQTSDFRLEPNKTVELSSGNYSKSPEVTDTYHELDHLQEKTSYQQSTILPKNRFGGGIVNGCIQRVVQDIIPDNTYLSDFTHKTVGDKTLDDMSVISKISEDTIRELPSVTIDPAVSNVLHSTLRYPLNSTMLLDNLEPIAENSIQHDYSECDSSVMSFCVDEDSFHDIPTSNCDVCKVLKRQTGQGKLQQPRRAVGLSESDFAFDHSALNGSLDATRGTIADPQDITCYHMDSTMVAGASSLTESSMDQTTVQNVTMVNRSRRHSQHISRKSQNHSNNKSSKSNSLSKSRLTVPFDSDSDKENSSALANRHKKRRSSVTDSNSSQNTNSSSFSSSLNREKKRELRRKLKKFKTEVNSKEHSVDIKTLGFF